MPEDRVVTFRLPPEMLARLSDAARARGCAPADLIRAALAELLGRQVGGGAAPVQPDQRPKPAVPALPRITAILQAARTWHDLLRAFRQGGVVLRQDAGGVLWLHSWPADRALGPAALWNIDHSDLVLRFGAPFPGASGATGLPVAPHAASAAAMRQPRVPATAALAAPPVLPALPVAGGANGMPIPGAARRNVVGRGDGAVKLHGARPGATGSHAIKDDAAPIGGAATKAVLANAVLTSAVRTSAVRPDAEPPCAVPVNALPSEAAPADLAPDNAAWANAARANVVPPYAARVNALPADVERTNAVSPNTARVVGARVDGAASDAVRPDRARADVVGADGARAYGPRAFAASDVPPEVGLQRPDAKRSALPVTDPGASGATSTRFAQPDGVGSSASVRVGPSAQTGLPDKGLTGPAHPSRAGQPVAPVTVADPMSIPEPLRPVA